MPPKYPPGRPLSPKTYEVYSRGQRNMLLPCSVPGCCKSRFGVAPICSAHLYHRNRYGHALGVPISPRDLHPVASLVVPFLSRNADHAAVKAAAEFFSNWLHAASSGHEVPARKEMAHLEGFGVTGTQLLEAATSCWVYSRWNPGRLPDDVRLTFALALCVFRVAPPKRAGVRWRAERVGKAGGKTAYGYRQPNYQCIPTTARRDAGELIRARLGLFLMNVTAALEAEDTAENNVRKALATGFTLTGSTLTGFKPTTPAPQRGEETQQ